MRKHTIFSCKWEVRKTQYDYCVETAEKFYFPHQLKQNKTPKKNVKKLRCCIGHFGRKEVAEHICLAHNMLLCGQPSFDEYIDNKVLEFKNNCAFVLGILRSESEARE